jgi:hypothetical protein
MWGKRKRKASQKSGGRKRKDQKRGSAAAIEGEEMRVRGDKGTGGTG